jgi:hypothetical protein
MANEYERSAESEHDPENPYYAILGAYDLAFERAIQHRQFDQQRGSIVRPAVDWGSIQPESHASASSPLITRMSSGATFIKGREGYVFRSPLVDLPEGPTDIWIGMERTLNGFKSEGLDVSVEQQGKIVCNSFQVRDVEQQVFFASFIREAVGFGGSGGLISASELNTQDAHGELFVDDPQTKRRVSEAVERALAIEPDPE